MNKAVRRLIVRYEDRLLAPPFDSWGPLRHAVLECGHVLRAVGTATHKRMACHSCEVSNQDTSRDET
jgi:hypothetical protein